MFTLFVGHRRHLITRLHHDAALYHLWTKGRQPGQRGPTRRYDGKAVFDDLSRWQAEGTHPIHGHIQLYSALLYSKHFERRLRVVLLLDTHPQKYVLLASTDEQQSAPQIAHYYHLRFQIELLFRDAKQFTGLSQCQARTYDSTATADRELLFPTVRSAGLIALIYGSIATFRVHTSGKTTLSAWLK